MFVTAVMQAHLTLKGMSLAAFSAAHPTIKPCTSFTHTRPATKALHYMRITSKAPTMLAALRADGTERVFADATHPPFCTTGKEMPAVCLLPLMIVVASVTKAPLTTPAKLPMPAASAGSAPGAESFVFVTKAQ
jgi:hypothetical protein